MVFEAVVTEVLNKVLGDYIENLDHKQLKIGIWGGELSAQFQYHPDLIMLPYWNYMSYRHATDSFCSN